MISFFKDFWRHEVGSSYITFRQINRFRDSKICYFKNGILNKYILGFKVPMKYFFFVHFCEAFKKLGKNFN